jgi:hypothetical protein
MAQRKGGIIQFQAGGVLYDAKGNFTYNLGREKREAIVGADGVHGYKAMPQPAFIEGEITDRGNLDLAALALLEDATVTLNLANGKVIVLRDAWFAAEGTGNTDEGNVGIRFEAKSGEEIS